MGKKKGMILTDLAIYLFAGSVILWASLTAYTMVRKTYEVTTAAQRERLDFAAASERIKFDMYREVDSIHIFNDGVRFTFKDFSLYTDGRYDKKIYYIRMTGTKLSYVVLGDKRVTMMISELVRNIGVNCTDNVMTIRFAYDGSVYERSYWIGHIKEKSIYNSIIPSPEY